MLAYSRSSHSSTLTIVWSIYLKACGLSARAFDALHALGLTMSHKWTADAFSKIAKAARADRLLAIADHPFFGSHDNLNIPMRVFSQRLHNMNHFINATASTIYVLAKEAFLPPDITLKVKAQRRATTEPFEWSKLWTEEHEAHSRINCQARHRILRFLLEAPAFISKMFAGP